MKMDVEKAEFELLPALLKSPKTARLVDELMLECHHAESRLGTCLQPHMGTASRCSARCRQLAFGRMRGFDL